MAVVLVEALVAGANGCRDGGGGGVVAGVGSAASLSARLEETNAAGAHCC